MSEQAQATDTAKAPPKPRTRPSRAKATVGEAKPNGAAHASRSAAQTQAEAGTLDRAAEQGKGAQRAGMHDAAQDDTAQRADTIDQTQAGAAQQEGRERIAEEMSPEEIAARTEAEQRRAEQIRALLATYQNYMTLASGGLGRTQEAVAEVSALLTFEPSNYVGAVAIIEKAGQGLLDFRQHLIAAAELGAEPYMTHHGADVSAWHVAAVDAMKEFRRRIDAKIALMETDIGNMPAIVALERTIGEQGMVAGVYGRGLGRLLAQHGLAR